MKIIGKEEAEITTVESWFEAAPPKGGRAQWVSRHSAKELAQAWCGSGKVVVPTELASLLDGASITKGLTLLEAWPEKKVRFDRIRGETRNADLAILGLHQDGRRVAISIEAKAKEPFDVPVAKKLMAAMKQIARDEPSNLPTRIHQLGRVLLPPHKPGDVHLGEIRYQLLTATAGAIALASQVQASAAILAIHEFGEVQLTEAEQQNATDLDVFMKRLTGSVTTQVSPGILYGPIHVPGSAMIPGKIPLWVGKIRRVLVSEEERRGA